MAASNANGVVSNGTAGKRKKIGVMTSGGDSPGMNGAVRAVVRTALSRGCIPYLIREGYDGLVQGNNLIVESTWEDVRGFLSIGGTLIGTARCAEFRERPGRLKAARNLIARGIDALVICGGDGSLTGADTFRKEWPGLVDELVANESFSTAEVEPYRHLNIVGLVGSIDNDMSLTDATIGCYSSLARICESIDWVNSTALSHKRAFVIEVMGRHCGWLALMAGVSTGADYILIPENPPDIDEQGNKRDWESHMCDVIGRHREQGKRKTIVIVAEGAHDSNLKKITPDMVEKLLSTRCKLDTRVTTLGHTQRGGSPCAYDRQLATLQGVEAVEAVLQSTPEKPSPVICVVENKITRRPLVEVVAATQSVTEAIQRRDFKAAMGKRDSEFGEYYKAFLLTTVMYSELSLPQKPKKPAGKSWRVGIIHVGAPAGGMNAASRAAVAYCRAQGYTAVALHNGFPGLCRHHADQPLGSVRELDLLRADLWATWGGSEIGTNRGLPSEDFGMTAFCFEKYEIDALFIIGGFEAFTALSELRQAREKYDAFKIPMVVLPATISNNVPGTEYSIGSDTCLNALMVYCDQIKQSANASRRRCFVVETQGGATGYIATLAGLSVGAVAVYTPEEGVSLDMIRRDIEHLRSQFQQDRGQERAGKILLRNEKASDIYTTQTIADIIDEEGGKLFECKLAVPGHVQQGGIPSPMDRTRAVRFSIRSLQHLEFYFGKSRDEIAADPLSTSVIGMVGSKVGMFPIETIEHHETDWKNRRPKNEFWLSWKDKVDMLSGRPNSRGLGRTIKDKEMELEVKVKSLEAELERLKSNVANALEIK